MINTTITIGTDPEFPFIRNGKAFPAGEAFRQAGILDRLELDTGEAIVDGVAYEANPRPGVSGGELVEQLQPIIQEGFKLAEYLGLGFECAPETPFDLEWCEVDPMIAVFGCDPDLSIYGEECRPGTIDASQHPFRYFGAHIHIGGLGDFDMHKRIKRLDHTVGLLSTYIGLGEKRRGVYGRPGIYREQPWGLEYRTPSNLILRTPKLAEQVFDLALQAVQANVTSIVPDELVVNIMRYGSRGDAKELYNQVAIAAGLPMAEDFDLSGSFTDWL
jgi:hypothetical protein